MQSSEITAVSRSVLSGHPDRRQIPSREKSVVAHPVQSEGGRRYVLRLIRRSPSTASYTWTVTRDQDSGVVARSRKTFASLMEALGDAARVMTPLALDGIEPDAMRNASG